MQSLDSNIQKSLERLELLERHHRYCRLAAPESAPAKSPPASPKVSCNEPEIMPWPDRAMARCSVSSGVSGKDPGSNHMSEPTEKPELDFIAYVNPPPEAPSEKKRREERPMREARRIVATVPRGSDWWAEWSYLGVTNEQNSKAVVASVAGAPSTCGSPSKATLSAQISPIYSIQDKLYDRLSAYAKVIVSSRPAAELAIRIASFQELVFVSACVALQKHKILDHAQFEGILRLGVRHSDSSRYLQRFGLGALWVNQTINVLSWNGWSHRAAPLFFFLKYDLAQYGRLALIHDSQRIFEDSLSSKEYLEDVTDVPALDELSIPQLVNRLLGNVLTQLEVEEALGYTATRPQLATGKKRKSNTSSTGRRKEQRVRARDSEEAVGGSHGGDHDELPIEVPHPEGSGTIVAPHSPAQSQDLSRQGSHGQIQHSIGHNTLEESGKRCQAPGYPSREPATIGRESLLNSQTYDGGDGAENPTTRNVGYNASTGATNDQGLPQGSKDDMTQPYQLASRHVSTPKIEQTYAVASTFTNTAQQALVGHNEWEQPSSEKTNGWDGYTQTDMGDPPAFEPDLFMAGAQTTTSLDFDPFAQESPNSMPALVQDHMKLLSQRSITVENQCFGTEDHGQTNLNCQTNVGNPPEFQPDLFMAGAQTTTSLDFDPFAGESQNSVPPLDQEHSENTFFRQELIKDENRYCGTKDQEQTISSLSCIMFPTKMYQEQMGATSLDISLPFLGGPGNNIP